MQLVSFMPDIYYKTAYCRDPYCELQQLCYYAHDQFEYRSVYSSVPVVMYIYDKKKQEEVHKKKLALIKEEQLFDDLEEVFIKRNQEFFL